MNVIRLPDCERVQGLYKPDALQLEIQWSALPATPPGQSPTPSVHALRISQAEAWRLMTFLALAYDDAGRPAIPPL